VNRKQRKLKHRRRVVASKPGQPRVDPKVTLLEDALQTAKRQRKGKARVIDLMARHGYVLSGDADHKDPASWHTLRSPKPALVKS
jgi:hypothetical protein